MISWSCSALSSFLQRLKSYDRKLMMKAYLINKKNGHTLITNMSESEFKKFQNGFQAMMEYEWKSTLDSLEEYVSS
jgi:hypothetical protein